MTAAMLDTLFDLRSRKEREICRLVAANPRAVLAVTDSEKWSPVISQPCKVFWKAVQSARPFTDEKARAVIERTLKTQGARLQLGLPPKKNFSAYETDADQTRRLIEEGKRAAVLGTLTKQVQTDPDLAVILERQACYE